MAQPAPTRPQLQAVNQDLSSDLDEQLRHIAHIIGLPQHWTAICGAEAQHAALQLLARPRAEWVLRWLLDKFKDETAAGRTARANATAWQLLDWMLHALPVSRSAPHLRDASLTTILERSLLENFGDHVRSPSATTRIRDDTSEPSDTCSPLALQPSRKRKRGTLHPIPSKRTAPSSQDPQPPLFVAVKRVLQSIADMGAAGGRALEATHAELIKMVLRTDATQAARILKFWLAAVYRFWAAAPSPRDPEILQLSLVNEIWDLRIVESSDETASPSQDFTDECLISTLLLSELLRTTRQTAATCIKSLDRAAQMLDKLLTRHLLVPARAAFLAPTNTVPVKPNVVQSAVALRKHLQPLRTELFQAAQMQAAGDTIPIHLEFLFQVVPQLLDLAIRVSPSKTPKGRLSERAWIQAVLISLVECLGCSMTNSPVSKMPRLAIAALERTLHMLHSHRGSVDAEVLQALFWNHCGIRCSEAVADVEWSLIAALIELDPAFFVTDSKSKLSSRSGTHQSDLVQVLFREISEIELRGTGSMSSPTSNANDQNQAPPNEVTVAREQTSKSLVVDCVIIPLMLAFARNRNLLGFLRQWDNQLMTVCKRKNSQVFNERLKSVWEDRALNLALEDLLEESLTQGQIAKLLQEHADRIMNFGQAIGMAASSAVIIPAILQSVQSDDNIGALESHLQSLLLSYTTWVQDDRYSAYTGAELTWFTLCQLTSKLWPLELHASAHLQETWLRPLLERATHDMVTGHKGHNGRYVGSASQAAAMLFAFDACDRLHNVPGFERAVQSSLEMIVETLSSSALGPVEHKKMTELFFAHFVLLLCHLNVDSCQRLFLKLLYMLSKFEEESRSHLSCLLSRTIFEQGGYVLQNAYLLALSEALGEAQLHEIAINAFADIHPSTVARDKREMLLDRLTHSLSQAPSNAIMLVTAMGKFMEVPNASAAISTNGDVLFDIADRLHEKELDTASTLQQFQHLVRKTLGHIIPNRDQSQSRLFFEAYTTKLDATIKDARKCSPIRLAILRATVLEQKDAQLLSVKQYAQLLKQCLSDDNTDAHGIASLEEVLDALNEIPAFYLQQAEFFNDCRSWLQSWIKQNADLDSYLTISSQSPTGVAEYIGRLHTTVAKFKIYPDAKWFIDLTVKVVRETLPDYLKRKAYATLTEAVAGLETREKLSLIAVTMDASTSLNRTASLRILDHVVSTLPDKLSANNAVKQKQLALLPRLCVLLAEESDDACFNALLDCINRVMNEKPWLTTQYGVESVLSVLVRLTSRTSPALSHEHASDTFARLCETSRLVLLVHRSRLGGRFHVVLPLLQNLLFCLFIPSSGRSGALPAWLRSASAADTTGLTSQNAAQYTRLVSTLCNPPQSSISKSHQHAQKGTELNDAVKAAREKASQFLYPLLGSFCRFQLAGRLEAGVRKKLMPGIWELVGMASLHKAGLAAMFGGMGRSEQDVWRSVWGEWEGVYGRKERVVNGEDV